MTAKLISFTIPMTKDILISEFNTQQHWTKRSKRHKQQQFLIKSYMNSIEQPSLPCHIAMTRIAPRSLDFVNLVGSFKWIQDAIADSIIKGLAPGRADGDERLTWDYLQRKGSPQEYALEIQLSFHSQNS